MWWVRVLFYETWKYKLLLVLLDHRLLEVTLSAWVLFCFNHNWNRPSHNNVKLFPKVSLFKNNSPLCNLLMFKLLNDFLNLSFWNSQLLEEGNLLEQRDQCFHFSWFSFLNWLVHDALNQLEFIWKLPWSTLLQINAM